MSITRRAILCLVLALYTAACGKQDAPAEKSLPGIKSHVIGMQHFAGFFDLYWDSDSGKIFLRVNDESPFIYVSGLARGVGSNDLGLDRGQIGDSKLVHFSRSGPKILLIEENPDYLADSDNPDEQRAVEESFARSVLWGFEAVAVAGNSVLIDATDFVLRDAHGLATTLKRSKEGNYKVDASRSAIYLPNTRSFPDNTEIEALVTLVGEPTGDILETVTPDASAVTVQLRHSLVRLPPAGYEPLPFDARAGYIDPASWGMGMLRDYATPIGESVERPLILRHRLKKKNPSAEKSEAIEPIVYYVDRGAPEPIRSALLEGAAWWNEAFEAAGYDNAFQVRLLPEGADPLDIRYNVIQWVHRSTRGWSYGWSVADPRTGEILKGHVSLGSLRVRQDYLLAEGLLAPYEDESVSDQMLQFALARIRQLAAHEVGHTIGLGHNFAASTFDRASVMDYPHPLLRLDANNKVDIADAYTVGLGAWDKRAILYGYQDFPADDDAAAGRQQILADTYAAGLNFISDRHSRADVFARNSGAAHPDSSLWDNGDDAIAELRKLMLVRQQVLDNFSEKTIRIGKPMASIEDALVPMYLLHRYQIKAAAKFVGGRYFNYTMRGDGRSPTQPVPADRQREALDALLLTLQPEHLWLDPRLIALIGPRPPGQGDTRELFSRQTGYLFDPLAAAASAAAMTIDQLLEPTRAARLINYHALDSTQPAFGEVLDSLLATTWYSGDANQHAELQRVVETAVLQKLIELAANEDAQSQVRAIALDRLVELNSRAVRRVSSAGGDWRAHYRFAADQVQRFLDNPHANAPVRAIAAPPGSPIG